MINRPATIALCWIKSCRAVQPSPVQITCEAELAIERGRTRYSCSIPAQSQTFTVDVASQLRFGSSRFAAGQQALEQSQWPRQSDARAQASSSDESLKSDACNGQDLRADNTPNCTRRCPSCMARLPVRRARYVLLWANGESKGSTTLTANAASASVAPVPDLPLRARQATILLLWRHSPCPAVLGSKRYTDRQGHACTRAGL